MFTRKTEFERGFRSTTRECTSRTRGNDVPRATQIEYHCKRLTLYFVAERSGKPKKIRNNPKVSIGIFLPYKRWDSAKGAQIIGKAKIVSRKAQSEFKEGLEAYQRKKTATEIGIREFPKSVELVSGERAHFYLPSADNRCSGMFTQIFSLSCGQG